MRCKHIPIQINTNNDTEIQQTGHWGDKIPIQQQCKQLNKTKNDANS